MDGRRFLNRSSRSRLTSPPEKRNLHMPGTRRQGISTRYKTRPPSDPWMKGLNYVLKREHQLRVFLEDPDVPMDTNHVEQEIRPIPLGRKNWLFCWTELGAEHLCLIQSLLSTCKLHDINPTTYLIDVLQRVSQHPAKDVIDLTPRIWKEKFADNPLRSVVDQQAVNHA
jgi:transposase